MLAGKSKKLLVITTQYSDKFDTTTLTLVVILVLGVFQLSAVLLEYFRSDTLIEFAGVEQYSHIAKNLIEQGLYSKDDVRPTAYRPPGYPLFLLPLIVLFGDSFGYAAMFVQALLDIGCGLLIVFISMRVFKSKLAALLSALLFGLHYTFHWESLAQRETVLFTFLVLLFFFFLLGKKSPLIYAVLAGLAALAYLTRPTGLLLFPVIFVDLLFQKYQPRTLLKHSFIVLISILVIIAPWHIYLYKNFQTFSFLPSSTAGINLYHGNNPDFHNIYPYVDVDRLTPMIQALKQAGGIDANEVTVDQFLRQEAWSFIRRHPARSIQNALVKLVAFYSPVYTPLGAGELVGETGNVVIKDYKFFGFNPTRLPHLVLVTLVLLGVLLFFRKINRYTAEQKIQIFLMGCFILFVTVLQMLTVGETRYRLPLDPLLILWAGEAYALFLISQFSNQESRRNYQSLTSAA